MKKRIIAMLLAITMSLCLCACGQRKDNTQPEFTEVQQTTEAVPEAILESDITTELITEPTTVPTIESTTAPTTETSTESPTASAIDEGIDYVLNINTRKFHYPGCSSAGKIKPSNRSDFHGTREEVISKGYDPCGHCHP